MTARGISANGSKRPVHEARLFFHDEARWTCEGGHPEPEVHRIPAGGGHPPGFWETTAPVSETTSPEKELRSLANRGMVSPSSPGMAYRSNNALPILRRPCDLVSRRRGSAQLVVNARGERHARNRGLAHRRSASGDACNRFRRNRSQRFHNNNDRKANAGHGSKLMFD